MKPRDILTPVNCAHGAPMGRRTYGLLSEADPGTVRLFQVQLDSGGYDPGGAYWGHGAPLWCAYVLPDDDGRGECRQFTRAHSRKGAALALEVYGWQLKTGRADGMPGDAQDEDEDEDEDVCEECARSYGPHYSGPCEHGGAP